MGVAAALAQHPGWLACAVCDLLGCSTRGNCIHTVASVCTSAMLNGLLQQRQMQQMPGGSSSIHTSFEEDRLLWNPLAAAPPCHVPGDLCSKSLMAALGCSVCKVCCRQTPSGISLHCTISVPHQQLNVCGDRTAAVAGPEPVKKASVAAHGSHPVVTWVLQQQAGLVWPGTTCHGDLT